jgi:hypothetical protein
MSSANETSPVFASQSTHCRSFHHYPQQCPQQGDAREGISAKKASAEDLQGMLKKTAEEYSRNV